MNRARFIVTVGPSSFSYDKMLSMIQNGALSFRVNTAHVEADYVTKVRRVLDEIIEDTKLFPSLLLDLKGPEIRIRFRGGERYDFVAGKEYEIGEGEGHDLFINQKGILSNLDKGDEILLNDGRIRMSLTSGGGETIKARSSDTGNIRMNARVNIPGKVLNLGSLTDRDREFVAAGIREGVEYFALSFVQDSKNVEELRNLIRELGGDQFIISKIETSSGVRNIESILRASDMIMIARGDLGVEMPLQEIAITQKNLIGKAHKYGIPSIVATQILESMVENETPTRAEISDITNAIIDNADILMLSDETAIGKNPIQSVNTLYEVTKYVESKIKDFPEPDEFYGNQVAYSLSKSAKIISEDIGADILVLTRSGNTVKMLSALRPKGKIYVITPSARMERKLSLFNNVFPVHIENLGNNLDGVMDEVKKLGIFRKGEILVTTSGEGYFTFGGTNDIRVEVIGKFIGRGYSKGKTVEGGVTYNPDGGGEILVTDQGRLPDNYEFRAVIFENRPLPSTVEHLLEKVNCVLVSTIFKNKPAEGEKVYIEARTGIIYQ